jgi:hypothetical protein
MLDQFNDIESPEVIWHCRAQEARRTEFMSRLSSGGVSMLKSMRDHMGPVSRSLADALT